MEICIYELKETKLAMEHFIGSIIGPLGLWATQCMGDLSTLPSFTVQTPPLSYRLKSNLRFEYGKLVVF